MKIGFIGQGFIGRNMADDFERRGYTVVRYALEPEYASNQKLIAECGIVFIAVPTPTTPRGFDYSTVEDVLSLVGDGKIAVIKSTILPGTTAKLQKKNPNKVVLFSPEFLSKKTAREDTENPICNILGLSVENSEQRDAAQTVMDLLPKNKNNFIISAEAAELFKYVHNVHGFVRIVLSNLYYDLSQAFGVNWEDIKQIIEIDPMMSPYYNDPIHQGGRGAGGCCFIKDFAAFKEMYTNIMNEDELGKSILSALERKNLALLNTSNKNRSYIEEVYGEGI